MKFIPLVWAGIWRKRGRAILILLQVIIAFTLYGVLQGLNTGIKQAMAKTHSDRLYVASKVNLGMPIPISLQARVQTLPGVLAVVPRAQFGATYQQANQGVAVIGTDPAEFMKMYSENDVDPAQLAAMKNNLRAVLVGSETMRQRDWKIGERITLQSPQLAQKNGSHDWTFDIVGTFSNREVPDAAAGIVVDYRYVNEARASARDTVNLLVVRIDDPTHAADVGRRIDSEFANSPDETLTQSEHQLVQSQINRIGDLDYIVHRITGAAFFVLLFATGALMMQSIRERTPELAVLKTVGFTDGLVMTLILVETTVLCIAGALIGLGLAARILPLARSFIGIGSVPMTVVVIGIVVAVALALAGGFMPAWRGLRLRVVDALADR